MNKLRGLLVLAVVALAGCGKGSVQSPDFTPKLVDVNVAPLTATVAAGRTVQFTGSGVFTAPPGSDNPTFESEADLDWSSDNTAFATVDGNGLAKGVQVGVVHIVGSKDGHEKQATLTVTAAVLESLDVQPATATIARGQTQNYTVLGHYSDGSTGPVLTAITWTSSDTNTATVTSPGDTSVATSVNIGSTTITATTTNGAGETISGTGSLTVTAPTLVALAVVPGTASTPAGLTQDFSTVGTYSDGTTGPITSAISWVSGNVSVATVTTPGATTTATGVAQGEATVTASTVNSLGTTVSGSGTLTVTAPILTSLTVRPPNPTIALGTAQSFSTLGHFSDGSDGPITSTIGWTSSDIGVATVAPASGDTTTATSVTRGNTDITATTTNSRGDTITGFTTLTVGAPAVASLDSVTPNPASVPLGTTQEFVANGTFTDSSTGPIDDSQVDWTSQTTQVATIGADGVATATAEGTTVIRATLKTGVDGSPRTATADMTVTAPVLQQIVITPATSSIAAGTTVELRALGIYSDSPTPRDITGEIDCPGLTPPVQGLAVVNWRSGVTSVATVDPDSGPTTLVTGVAASPTAVEITARSVNEQCVTVIGRADVTVTAAVLSALIRVEPATNFVIQGLQSSPPFTAIGQFSDGSEHVLDNALVDWTSAPTATATIDDQGVATGVAPGTATITATLTDPTSVPTGAQTSADASLTVTDSECTGPLLSVNGATTFTSTAGLCLAPLCQVVAPDNAIDNDAASAARIDMTLGLLGTSATLGVNSNLPTNFAPGQPAGFRISRPAGLLLSAELLSQVTVSTLINGGVVESSGATNALRLTLLGQLGQEDFAILSFVPTLPYNGIALTFNSGVASALTTTNVSAACATVALPPAARLVTAKKLAKQKKHAH